MLSEKGGLVLGRGGLTSQGVIVHPGIIDEDFKGETAIMAYIAKNVQCTVEDRIAQLLLLL